MNSPVWRRERLLRHDAVALGDHAVDGDVTARKRVQECTEEHLAALEVVR